MLNVRRVILKLMFLLLLSLMVACASGGQPKADTPTKTEESKEAGSAALDIEAYMSILSVSNPEVSPDGWIYYKTWSTGVDQIYRVREKQTETVTDETLFPEGVDFFSLSPDGNYLVIGADEGGNEQFSLYLMKTASPGEGVQAVAVNPEERVDGALWSSDSTFFVFRANGRNGKDFDVCRVDVATKKRSTLFEREGYTWIHDVSPDGNSVLFARYWGGNLADLYLGDVTSGQVRQLTEKERTSGSYDSARFLKDGQSIIATTDDGFERSVIVRMNLATGERKKISQVNWDIESLSLSPARDLAAYVYNEHGASRLVLAKPEDLTEIRKPELGLGLISGISFGNGFIVCAYSNPTQTVDLWRIDLNDGAISQVTFSDYAGVDRSRFVMPELVHYPTFDGRSIPAFLYRPKGYENQPAPYVIYAHGGPESQFRPQFIRSFQFMLERGIGVLAPNVRGSSGYGPAYLELDNYKKRMDSITDFEYAARYLIDNKIADPKRLGIRGGSYGGYVVMASITEYPERYAAAINSVGIVNFLTYFQRTKKYRRAVREKEYGPMSDEDFLRSISPIFKIDRVMTPLMIVHGENDPRVPVQEARQIIEALTARNQVVEPVIFPDEGHGVQKLENRLELYRQMDAFLLRYLKPDEVSE